MFSKLFSSGSRIFTRENLKITTAVAGLTGIPVGVWYLTRPQCVPLDEQQKKTLMEYVPNVYKINSLFEKPIIIGGSTALKLYTNRYFQTSDIDIFVNSKYDWKESCGALYHDDVKNLAENFSSNEWVVNSNEDDYLTNDNIVRKRDRNTLMMFTPSEHFDELISHTINTTFNNDTKVQFIFFKKGVNVPETLKTKHDIPVIISYNKGESYFLVRSIYEGLLAKYGYLIKMNTEERKEKYKHKDFWIL